MDIDETIQNSIGEDSDEICEVCGENLVINKTGTKWCECGWSNDEELSRFLKELKDGII